MAFSTIELQLIEKEMQIKSAADIAFLLDVPVSDVKAAIRELASGSGVRSRQEDIEEKEALRKAAIAARPKKVREPKAPKEKKVKPLKTFDRVITSHVAHELREKKKRTESPQYETKQLDYSQKKMVQIAKGTWVYVSDPEELEKEKEKYYRNRNTRYSKTDISTEMREKVKTYFH
jgi:hypothetical protein